ncbi:NAD(P)-dependent oxidoreductase [Paenarthrobacter sp. DKR-5]|uniref:NAD(P)-dependent oxidoreductase n=1 Tax=Paenarthrobacter sp. DKR-5 TaxID=2835535 RepID=UPI001BDC45A8|nr:NAD(P)-dependent oxidoreductase [Paenarthrobacter sp. DKR-5]MBT1004142.1 NAD(P)-dependent oxidoreductase [Paenarthrobacter sp. DKR-5]
MTKVGWIGLGAMGGPMAVVLAGAGHQISAFDVAEGRAESLARDGLRPAATAKEAVAEADVVALMVATPAQADAVLFGPDELAASLRPGTVVLLMATVGPAAVVSLAQRLEAFDVEVVDAPVSGGTARAATGDLLMMVSGSERALGVARPLLDAMAGSAPVVGPNVGDGQKVKLVNQLLCGVHIAVAGEALAFAEALGLEAKATWEVLRSGAAASFMLDDRGARMVDETNTEVRSALDIFVKDMGLVVEAARENTYPAPLAAAAEQLYLNGRRAGFGRRDDSSVIEVLRGHLS